MSTPGFVNHSKAPDANVLFFPFSNEETTLGPAIDPALLLKQRESNSGKGLGAIEAKNDIIQVTTSKSKGSVGQFSVLLGSARNYKGLLHPGCWCLIYLSDGEVPSVQSAGDALNASDENGFKMLGIVRSVRRKEATLDNGVKVVRYLVSGEDFQSAFHSQVYLSEYVASQTAGDPTKSAGSLGFPLYFMDTITGTSLSPDRLVSLMMSLFMGAPFAEGEASGKSQSRVNVLGVPAGKAKFGQAYIIPHEVKRLLMGDLVAAHAKATDPRLFMSIIVKLFQPNLVGTMDLKYMSPTLTSAWALMESYAHKILNELYTDLLPVNVAADGAESSTRLLPCVILRCRPTANLMGRERPHSSMIFLEDGLRDQGPARKNKSVTTVHAGTAAHFYRSRRIFEDEIISFDSGKSDHERKNFFFISANLVESQTENALQIVTSILQGRGVKEMADLTSVARYGFRPLIQQSNFNISGVNGETLFMNKIVRELWRNAAVYENGTVVVIGSRTHIPVGTLIEFEDRGWVAYVERVDHSFIVNPDGVKQYRTTIAFVRLQNKDGSPIDAVENHREDGQIGEFDRGISESSFGP